jgi:hypothetical protein
MIAIERNRGAVRRAGGHRHENKLRFVADEPADGAQRLHGPAAEVALREHVDAAATREAS